MIDLGWMLSKMMGPVLDSVSPSEEEGRVSSHMEEEKVSSHSSLVPTCLEDVSSV